MHNSFVLYGFYGINAIKTKLGVVSVVYSNPFKFNETTNMNLIIEIKYCSWLKLKTDFKLNKN